MATQETVKQITQGGVTRDVEDTTARQGLASKVDKNGTDSLMTAAEHTKLAGIAAGAQVNVINSISVNNTPVTPVNGNVNISVETQQITVDSSPTANSDNPVTSGGVYDAIEDKLTSVVVNEITGAEGVSVAHQDGMTIFMFGSSGGSAQITASPSISSAASGLNKLVTITNNDTDDANAAIYYTTDGSTPTTSSTEYSAPFLISETKTIKAIAEAEDKLPSNVVSVEVTVESNSWTDGYRFTRNDNNEDTTTEASGWSLSPYIPVENGDILWVWCGKLYSETSSPYTSVVLYDSSKNRLGSYHTIHYERKLTLNTSGVAYIRFDAHTADKGKTFVMKMPVESGSQVLGEAGTFLFKGSSLTADYDKLCGFQYMFSSNGIQYIAVEAYGDGTYDYEVKHYCFTEPIYMVGYNKLVMHYNFTGAANYVCAQYLDSSLQPQSYHSSNGYNNEREVTLNESFAYARFMFDGMDIHSCYVIAQKVDNGTVTETTLLWKGVDAEIPSEYASLLESNE